MATTKPVIVFDVNETFSDISPTDDRFREIGAPAELANVALNRPSTPRLTMSWLE